MNPMMNDALRKDLDLWLRRLGYMAVSATIVEFGPQEAAALLRLLQSLEVAVTQEQAEAALLRGKLMAVAR